jgi:hypothetical protein
LYYPNGKGWFDVHPVVTELLEEWESEHREVQESTEDVSAGNLGKLT